MTEQDKREKVIKGLETSLSIGVCGKCVNECWYGDTIASCHDIIRDALALLKAQVPVVHAKWQGVTPFVDTKECSNCRYNIQSEELETPYCPWCGAIMDGERRDSE